MRTRLWIMGLALLALLGVGGVAAHFWFGDASLSVRPPPVPPVTKPLADRSELVGEWLRVEAPEPGMVGHWRTFTAKGEFRACYGCAIYWGTYRFVDDRTIETRDGHDGALNRWTVGRADGKVVLVHQEYGWVEQYVSAPPGVVKP